MFAPVAHKWASYEFGCESFYKHFTPPGLARANTSNKLVFVMKSNEANSNQAMNDEDFWFGSSELSLDRTWNNSEDNIYVELLEELD